jgi:bisanhydrobacterioruberin hydratase
MEVNSKPYIAHFRSRQKAISVFFIVFYTVGLFGMLLPGTFSLFLQLIPLALILSFVALAFFHKSKTDWKTIVCFLSIYIIAFIVEAIGVNTGSVFGYYEYGEGLGIKVFQTPLIIGINWLFLVYTTSALVDKLKFPAIVKIILASFGMLLYDFVLEQVAPKLDMWHWKNGVIPFQNYLAWFTLAFLFHSLFKIMKVKIENKLALLILACQFLFFLLLFIWFKLML